MRLSRRIPPPLTASLLLLTALTPLQAQRRVSYFWEAGGSGGLTSLNLDVRPGAGLHLRAGGGLLLSPTLPMTASYVIGRGSSALEIGGGATVIFFSSDTSGSLAERFVKLVTLGQGLGTVVTATGILGYRYQQPGGFLFRATFTPFFPGGHFSAWGGLSIGGAF